MEYYKISHNIIYIILEYLRFVPVSVAQVVGTKDIIGGAKVRTLDSPLLDT
jgi:hypothetical protein